MQPAPWQPAVLIIAGVDSSGGAGLLRDLAVLRDLQVDAMCAVTAVTAQSHVQMRDAHHVPASIIRSQLAAVFETRPVAAVKIGMLGTRATVEAVASSLPSSLNVPIVLDPVLVSSSGAELLDREGLRALRALLLPQVALLTPNLPEAATLVGAANPAVSRTEILQQGQALLRSGPRAVLIKGGHASGDLALDYFFGTDHAMQTLAAPRLEHTARGTGCTLASAIAAELARGVALPEACTRAKRYVTRYLMRAAPSARASAEQTESVSGQMGDFAP